MGEKDSVRELAEKIADSRMVAMGAQQPRGEAYADAWARDAAKWEYRIRILLPERGEEVGITPTGDSALAETGWADWHDREQSLIRWATEDARSDPAGRGATLLLILRERSTAECVQAGQLATLRGALEAYHESPAWWEGSEDHRYCLHCEESAPDEIVIDHAASCPRVLGASALASDAGEREAEVLRAARVLFEAERRCSVAGVGIDMHTERSATSVPGAYRALLRVADALWGGEGEGG